MASKRPKVFVTRLIPTAGLDRVKDACDADVWDGPLPPERGELLKRIAGCEGVLALLTEKVDAEFFDAAGPQLKVARRANRRDRRHGVHLADRRRPPAHRVARRDSPR
jgi:hypothetical protein